MNKEQRYEAIVSALKVLVGRLYADCYGAYGAYGGEVEYGGQYTMDIEELAAAITREDI